MSLQEKLVSHCQSSLEPMVMNASPDGVESMGYMEMQVETTLQGILQIVTDWLKENDVIPPKAIVLAWVGETFDTYIAVRPPFAGRPFITRVTRQGLMTLVSSLYDSL